MSSTINLPVYRRMTPITDPKIGDPVVLLGASDGESFNATVIKPKDDQTMRVRLDNGGEMDMNLDGTGRNCAMFTPEEFQVYETKRDYVDTIGQSGLLELNSGPVNASIFFANMPTEMLREVAAVITKYNQD